MILLSRKGPGGTREWLYLFILFFPLAASLFSCGAEEKQDQGPYTYEGRADPQNLRHHVEFLASDELRGRKTGTPGVRRAEEYIARRFEEYGLLPLPGEPDFFLEFSVYQYGFDEKATALTVTSGSKNLKAGPGRDFKPFPFSPDGSWEGDLVFAGYGITAPEYGYDDYEGLDVRGKIVLVLRYEPSYGRYGELFDGNALTRHALFAEKAENARKHGAAGMFLFTGSEDRGSPDDLRLRARLTLDLGGSAARSGSGQGRGGGPHFPSLHVSTEFARRILDSGGGSLEALERQLHQGAAPSSLRINGVRAKFTVERSSKPDKIQARNVAGFIPGADSELRDEWVVVGAHHDHIGSFSGTGDTVYNGADDNASGVAGVLETARLMAGQSMQAGAGKGAGQAMQARQTGQAMQAGRTGQGPARSVLFVTFAAEEEGLLGSRAMVERQLPEGRVVFMINLDMIGRNPESPVLVGGDGYARGLRQMVGGMPDALDLRFAGTSYLGNSDHHPFFEQDIPFLAFFTGVHPDYHGLDDEAHKLEYGRMAHVVEMVHGVAEKLALGGEVPGFIHRVTWLGLQLEESENGSLRRDAELKQNGPSQGSENGSRAQVTGVGAGSRAAANGFRQGALIKSIDEQMVRTPAKASCMFQNIEPGTSTQVTLLYNGSERTVSVYRPHRGYLGVMPDDVPEDQRSRLGLEQGEGVLLSRVLPDTPASVAGLRAGDVIVCIDGLPVGTFSLGPVLAQKGAGEQVELTVIRNGKRRNLQLTLGRFPS